MKLSDVFQSLWPITDDYGRYVPAEEPDEDVIAFCSAEPVDQGATTFERKAYALTPTSLVVASVIGTRTPDGKFLAHAEATISSYPRAQIAYVERKHTFDYSTELSLINRTKTKLVFHFAAASGIQPIPVTQWRDQPESQFRAFFKAALGVTSSIN